MSYKGYNGDTVHDMWVDGMYGEGEYADDYSDGDYYARPPYSYVASPKLSLSEKIADFQHNIEKLKGRIASLNAKARNLEQLLSNPNLDKPTRQKSEKNLIKARKKIEALDREVERVKSRVLPLIAQREHNRNVGVLWGCIVVAACIILCICL